ncbi:PHP domain-containing protein [Halanaeroarchaeum sulfurireducens]|uniref:PHP domain-containing protein n=1 Tax=Halanaeroarchaeum sulfurireducens TaxID=1604004 RepID=A0A0F7PBK5_9EURY|nr:PHP domain-containing protein [Halanaeroarchaeum sulfurireducens]AKH98551.1 PHP domain-containing protein [Halanaeroarchaeum sulfurireducens]
MVYADLHVHTDASDGTLSLSALPDAARRSGIGAVAVTDHDRLHPGLSAPVAERDGVEVVAGIELRVEASDQRVDLLGYAVDPTDALEAELDRLQRDRVNRGRTIIDCVEDRLGVSIDVDLDDGVGRPHVARAVVAHPDTPYDRIGDVFEDLIGESDPCFVARDVTDFETGAALLRESSALVSLAHPFRYPDPEGALALCDHLDAVEASYPYDEGRGDDGRPRPDSSLLSEAVEAYDLLETGGSDAHGTSLGAAGLTKSEYERVASRLPRP